jgi:hypothetical protein
MIHLNVIMPVQQDARMWLYLIIISEPFAFPCLQSACAFEPVPRLQRPIDVGMRRRRSVGLAIRATSNGTSKIVHSPVWQAAKHDITKLYTHERALFYILTNKLRGP